MRLAIIGGGIGGATAALALRQFGFEPQVFEQAPHLLEVGSSILMWPNAMRVLTRLGLAETIRERGGILEQAQWLNHDGTLLKQFQLPITDVPAVALHRAELQSAMLGALPQEAIHLGHVFERYENVPDGIVAHFANRSSFECDLLIAADGVHSAVRQQFLNDGPPTDSGYLAWRGVVANASDSIPSSTAIEIFGAGQRFGIGPLGSGKFGWWTSTNALIPPADALTMRDKLLKLFAGWYQPVIDLIEATSLNSLIRNAVQDRRPVRGWSAGGVTLLGDAVHPTTPNLGQGGCLAIEDAAVLARCLHHHAASRAGGKEITERVSRALQRFEQLRYSRTASISRYSRLYGMTGQWENPAAVQLRRLALSLTPKVVIHRFLEKIFAYDAYKVNI
jgi:2-polyprenyl-6-methoxyphenol hydroxylase-like FAD-dependent oxidoreductase